VHRVGETHTKLQLGHFEQCVLRCGQRTVDGSRNLFIGLRIVRTNRILFSRWHWI